MTGGDTTMIVSMSSSGTLRENLLLWLGDILIK